MIKYDALFKGLITFNTKIVIFFLMETPKASLECHRLDEALQNLSELILN